MIHLPVWIDDNGQEMYHLPDELIGLREGEKLLIQMVSPYIPLKYLKIGAYGSEGHVCCFPQDIKEVYKTLPKKKVEAIKIIKGFKNEDGTDNETTFMIRRTKVLNALKWLKKYNVIYRELVTIDPSNLDWMESDEERELQVSVSEDFTDEENIMSENSNERQHTDHAYGVIFNDPTAQMPQTKDKEVTQIFENLSDTMNFPYVSDIPCNEFDESERIFCKAFPWLFPGGVGDIHDFNNKLSIEDWLKKLILYEDGRFAADKGFCFYGLNYLQRRKNMDQGSYYIKNFNNQTPQSLEELQKQIKAGNTTWIDKIIYFGASIKGSSSYWRQRRDEIHSWIQYHIHMGHGGPSAFMTLSCAEFYWPDIQRLMRERCQQQGKTIDWKDNQVPSQLINDLTVVIQEYFQIRVQTWIETVGKPIFGIKHYWLRYEFAPGRGQIHAHMLLILDNLSIQKKYYDMKQNYDDPDFHCATLLQEWVERQFGMATSVPNNLETQLQPTKDTHPSKQRLQDIDNTTHDAARLLMSCQNHMCTNYCMRKRKYL